MVNETSIILKLRPETSGKFRSYADKRRLKFVEVADVAMDALLALSDDQQNAIIERRHIGEPADETSLQPQ